MNKASHQFLKTLFRSLATVLLVCIAAGLVPPKAYGEGVRTIPFSARLRNPLTESVVSNGNYRLTFRIYTSATGGTAVWTEQQDIAVNLGAVVASLGSVTPFPSDLHFDGDTYYLEVQVNDDAPFSPRKRIESVPSAFNANRLDGAKKGTGANNILQLDSAGDITIAGGANLGSTLSVTGASTFTGDLTVSSNILASAGSIDIGSSSQRFGTAYVDVIDATTSSIGGTTNSEFTVNSDAGSGETSTFQFAKGSSAYAGLQWDGSANHFNLLANVGDSTFANLKVNGFAVGPSGGNTVLLPNANTTLVGDNTTQTLTNKTLTAPTLTGTVTGSSATLTGFTTYGGATLNGGNLSSTGVNGITINSATSTITGGTWGASTIAANRGGTGQNSYDTGDILYAQNSSTLQRLSASGNTGKYLRISSGGVPEWATVETGGDITEVTTDASSGLSGGNTSGAIALSLNRAYSNTWTTLQTITNTGASLVLDGNVSASASVAKLRLGSAISNGNSVSNGGTYIGINTPASGNPGAAADFLNFQVDGDTKLQVTSSGALAIDGALTVGSGGIAVTGNSTITGTLSGLTGLTTSGTVTLSSLSASGVVMTDGSSNLTTGTVSVAQGGTGQTSLASGGLIYGNGAGGVNVLSISGTNGQCLTSNGSAPAWTACTGGVNSIDNEDGDVDIAYATGNGSGTITIQDATSGQKGVVQVDGTNITASSGVINTAQNISSAASPSFVGLTLSGASTFSGNLNANGGLDIDDVFVVADGGALTTSGSATFSGTVAINGVPTISQDITFSATTPSIAINNGATLSVTDGTNNLLQLADNGTSATLTVGNATISGLSSGALYSNSGVLTSEAQLSVSRGGTGAGSFTSGGILYGNGTGAILATSGGSDGECLLFTGGTPQWGSCTGATGVGDITAVGNTLSGKAFTDDNTSSTELYFYDADGYGLLTIADLGASRTYTLPNLGGEICVSGGNCEGSGSASTLQAAYDAGNQISLTSARDLNVILADRTTDPNFDIDIASNSTGTVSIVRAAGSGTSSPSQFLLLEDLDADLTVGDALTIRTAGVLTDAIDVSDAEIVNALNVGDNTIIGTTAVIDFTNFDLAADGTITNATWSGAAIPIANGGTGATTAGDARTNLGLGSISTQAASGVTITGGTINNVAIGGSTPASGAFTTIAASGVTTLSDNLNANGGLDVDDAFVVADGGNLTTSGSATFNGAVNIAGTPTISQDIIFSASTPSIAISNASTLSITDGTNNLLQLADNGTSGTLTVANATVTALSTGVVYASSGALTSEAQLSVARGGTGLATIASGGLLYGNGTSAANVLSITGSSGQCLTSTGSAPQWQDCSTVTGVGDITAVNTGNGLSGGDDAGAVTIDIDTAYDFVWSGAHTFEKTGATSLIVSGVPTNVSTSSLIQIGSAISSGNSSTDGGTILGINLPAEDSGATSADGSAADFLNFQANGVQKVRIDSAGNATFAGLINTASITGGNISGGTINGADISGGELSDNAVNGLNVSGGVISGAATWTGNAIGALYGGTGLSSYTAGDILYAATNNPSSLTALGKGTTGNCLIQGASNAPEWGSCAGSGAGGVTLQAAYNNGATIDTTAAKGDIVFTITNQATDANFLVDIDSGVTSDTATGRFAVQNAGTDVFRVITSGATVAGTLAVTGNTTLTGDLAVNGGDITSTATTFNLAIGNTGTFNVTDGTNNLLTVTDSGSYGTTTTAGGKIILGQISGNAALSLNSSISSYTLYQSSTVLDINRPTSSDLSFSYNGTAQAFLTQNGDFGIGTSNAGNVTSRLTLFSNTSPQIKAGYSTSQYLTVGVSSTGGVTLDATGTSPSITLADATTVSGLLTASSGITSGGNIVPSSDSAYSLGSSSAAWSNLYVDTINSITGNDLSFKSATGIALFNTASTDNVIRLYDSNGDYSSLTSTNGELQLAGGDGTNQFILGDSSAAVNLVFEKSSSISTNTSGGTITIGDSNDVIALNNAATYNIGTLTAPANATINTTLGSGTGLTVKAASGASTIVDFLYAGAIVASINNAGALSAVGITNSSTYNTNTFTSTALTFGGAGTATISSASGQALTFESGTTGTINLGTDSSAETINVGTGAADKDVTLGSTTTGSTTAIQGATSISIAGVAATTIALGTTSQTGTITVGQSTAANTVNIATGAISTGTQTVNIATGATSSGVAAVTVGSTNSSSALTLNSGTGAINIGTSIAKTITVGNTTTTTALVLQSGTGDLTLSSTDDLIANLADNGTDSLDIQEGTNNYININTTNSSENISFGNATTNPSFSFLGSGNVTVAGDVAVNGGDITSTSSSFNLLTSSVTTLTVGSAVTTLNLITGNTAATLNIGTGTGGNAINIGTGAASNTITIGSTTGSTAISLKVGTGGVKIGDGGTSNYATFDSNGSLTFSGNARPYSEVTLMADDAAVPGSNGCTLQTNSGTNYAYKTNDCDASTDESFTYQFKMPANYVNSSDVAITLYWVANSTAASADAYWDAGYVTGGTAVNFNTASLTASVTGTVGTASTTAYGMNSTTITFTSPSINAGDVVNLKITRDADNGSDDLAADAQVLMTKVIYLTGN